MLAISQRYGFSMVAALLVGTTFGATRFAVAGERHTQVSAEALYTNNPPNADYDEDLASSGAVTSFVTPSAGATFCIAGATSGYKTVKAIALVQDGGPLNGAGNADAYARSMDKVTFETNQVGPGESVIVQAVLKVDGLLTGSSSCPIGQSFWLAGATLTLYYGQDGAQFIAHESYGFIDNDPKSEDFTFDNGNVIVNLDLINGVQFQLIFDAFSYTSFSMPQECVGHAKSDIGNTFQWMGVIGATDNNGNPITAYTLTDEFGADWTTPPPVADINIDGVVNVADLLAVINAWGVCPADCPPACDADIAPAEGDCNVNVSDLLAVINNWGN